MLSLLRHTPTFVTPSYTDRVEETRVVKNLTPIERAIAGQSTDRRKRYEERMRARGFVRATFKCHSDDRELIGKLAKKSRELSREDFEKLLDQMYAIAGIARTDGTEGARSPSASSPKEQK